MAYDKLDLIPDHYWIGGQICQVIMATFAGKKTDVSDWIPKLKPWRVISGEEGQVMFRTLKARARAKQEGAKPSQP